jgi:type I restriction enzyme S subunit
LGYVNGKFTTTHTFVIKVKPEYSSKYVYYYLLLNDKLSEKSKGIIPYIKNEDVLTLQVILPPIETQKEIVATLDRIYAPGTTELAETLKLTDRAMDLVLANPGGASLEPIVEAQRLMRKSAQMVADVKAQMVAVVRASSIRSTSVIRSLNDVCSVSFGERITQKNNKGTLYPVYGGGEANFHTDRFNREGKTCKVARFAVSEKSMVLMINEKYWLMDSGFTVTSKAKDTVYDEFLWWILWANQKKISECSTGSCQKNIAMDMFYKLEFGFPSIEDEKRENYKKIPI